MRNFPPSAGIPGDVCMARLKGETGLGQSKEGKACEWVDSWNRGWAVKTPIRDNEKPAPD